MESGRKTEARGGHSVSPRGARNEKLVMVAKEADTE